MSDEAAVGGGGGAAGQRIRLGLVVLDTPDPRGFAAFYAALLGWQVDAEESADDWVTIRGPGASPLAFQLAPDHITPTWPAAGVPHARAFDALIAATALANGLAVYTCNAADFAGIDGLKVVAVTHPDQSS